MLNGESVVPHYPWHDPSERANLAFVELRRVRTVERQCFTSFRESQNVEERQDRAALLTDAQRVCQGASREYTAALTEYVAVLRDNRLYRSPGVSGNRMDSAIRLKLEAASHDATEAYSELKTAEEHCKECARLVHAAENREETLRLTGLLRDGQKLADSMRRRFMDASKAYTAALH
jgi:hypothetical protein